MKRSKKITLILLASISSLAVTGCGDPDNKIFHSKEECLKTYDQKQCDDAWNQAQNDYTKNAPKFTSMQDCENQFGLSACQTAPNITQDNSQSMFMPFMLGYMMGNYGGGYSYTPIRVAPYAYRLPLSQRQIFVAGGPGYIYSSRLSPIGYMTSRSSVTSFNNRSSYGSSFGGYSSSRGGFGSRGGGFGGFSGGG